MGGLSCCAAFELNRHNAVGKKSNGRKNSQANAQGAVRDAQDEDLLKVVDLSQSRSVEAPPSLQQASRKRMQAAKESIGLKAEAGHQTSAASEC